MMPRFTVRVSEEEFKALEKSAAIDIRDFRSQARLLIRSELERRGLLKSDNQNKTEAASERANSY